MFIRKRAITLIFPIVVLLVLAAPSSANGILPGSVHRRDHVDVKRMIKMRAPADKLIPGVGAIGAGNDPPVGSSSTTPSPSPSPSPTPSNVPQVSSDSSSLVSSTSPSSSALSSSSSSSSSTPSSLTSLTSSIVSRTTTSSTPSTPTSASTSSTVSTPQALSVINAPVASVDSVTLTSHVPAASTAAASDNSEVGGTSLSHTTLTIIIVLAASVGGIAIIWTIIRKWKFRPSAEFEDRLEPIDWQPTVHDSGLPTHRRVPSNASSFHSAGNEHGGLAGTGSQNNAGRSLTPLPEHDFTAGAALAPVGGYADLARGPSPQPQMQEGNIQRGLSVSRGYDPFSPVPLHHQGGYTAQDAYDYNNNAAGAPSF